MCNKKALGRIRSGISALLVLVFLGSLSASCSLVSLLDPAVVQVPGLPSWTRALSIELYWVITSPALAEGIRLKAPAHPIRLELGRLDMPKGGTWLLAELQGPRGELYARLGCVWGQVVAGQPVEEKELDSTGGAVASVMKLVGGNSTNALRFNHVRLYRELECRLGADSWMINPTTIVSMIADDTFRSDRLRLPPRPESLTFPPGHEFPEDLDGSLRSLDQVFASSEHARAPFSQGWRQGTWRFYNIASGLALTVSVREDGRGSLLCVPCGSGLPRSY